MDATREANLIVGDNVSYQGQRTRVTEIVKGPDYVDGEFMVAVDLITGRPYLWTSELD